MIPLLLSKIDSCFDLRKIFKNEFLNMKRQLLIGLLLMILIFGVFAIFYFANGHYILFKYFDTDIYMSSNSFIGILIVLGFVNPICEELFWRVFTKKCLVDSVLTLIFTEFHYAIYHFFTVTYLFNSTLGLLAFVGILVVGIT